jgi:hypothetical protein
MFVQMMYLIADFFGVEVVLLSHPDGTENSEPLAKPFTIRAYGRPADSDHALHFGRKQILLVTNRTLDHFTPVRFEYVTMASQKDPKAVVNFAPHIDTSALKIWSRYWPMPWWPGYYQDTSPGAFNTIHGDWLDLEWQSKAPGWVPGIEPDPHVGLVPWKDPAHDPTHDELQYFMSYVDLPVKMIQLPAKEVRMGWQYAMTSIPCNMSVAENEQCTRMTDLLARDGSYGKRTFTRGLQARASEMLLSLYLGGETRVGASGLGVFEIQPVDYPRMAEFPH